MKIHCVIEVPAGHRTDSAARRPVFLHVNEAKACDERDVLNHRDADHHHFVTSFDLDESLAAVVRLEEIRDAMYKFTRVDRGVFPVALMDKPALQSTLEEIWAKVKSPTEKAEPAAPPIRTVVAGEDLKPGDPVVVKTPSPAPAGKVRTYDTWVLEEMSPQGVPKFIASYSSESMARHKLAKLSSATGLEYRVVKSVLTVEEPPKPAPKFNITVMQSGTRWTAHLMRTVGFGDDPLEAVLNLARSATLHEDVNNLLE